jgi:hypothetical protein
MRPTVPAVVIALALAAGCGFAAQQPQQADPPASGPATTSGSGAGAGGGPQCPANSVIATTLGIAVTETQEPTRFGTSSVVCTFDGTLSSGTSANVTLRLQTGTSASDYADFRTKSAAQGFSLTDRSGIGDEAFTYVFGPAIGPINAVVARKGDLLVYLGSQASFEQEVALLKVLFAH